MRYTGLIFLLAFLFSLTAYSGDRIFATCKGEAVVEVREVPGGYDLVSDRARSFEVQFYPEKHQGAFGYLIIRDHRGEKSWAITSYVKADTKTVTAYDYNDRARVWEKEDVTVDLYQLQTLGNEAPALVSVQVPKRLSRDAFKNPTAFAQIQNAPGSSIENYYSWCSKD